MTHLRLKRDVTTAQSPDLLQGIGTLTEWNDERGYGFITPESGGCKVFLHVKSLKKEARRPAVGELFFYTLTTDKHNRPRAEEAFQTILSEKRDLPVVPRFMRRLADCWLLAVLIPAAIAVWQNSLALGVTTAFVINSLLTIAFYRVDKFLAQYKYWRIPETNLHLWELLCGWPGAIFAQQKYRHKRSKTSFKVIFWLCVIINCGAILCLVSPVVLQNTNHAMRKFYNSIVETIQVLAR